ncbi:MAG: hypothetical protein KME27_06640 [Lyngbya sp. HA4199-MV5]|jgi:hypothetical protein|nr:hypothetical protein [Lyngbya sp. HA4199-MV5]
MSFANVLARRCIGLFQKVHAYCLPSANCRLHRYLSDRWRDRGTPLVTGLASSLYD